jgi:hypothetical protein
MTGARLATGARWRAASVRVTGRSLGQPEGRARGRNGIGEVEQEDREVDEARGEAPEAPGAHDDGLFEDEQGAGGDGTTGDPGLLLPTN